MSSKGNFWQDWEIEIIVGEYLEMLAMELTGKQFIKAQRNRNLQNRLDRTKGSIEYKHQNISAVMDRLGHPYIKGYRPAINYQRSLFEMVDNQLPDSKILELATQPGKAIRPERGVKFFDPPTINNIPPRIDNKVKKILRKYDPAVRDAKARELGEAGKKYFYDAEKYRLARIGRGNLADKVKWVAKEDGDGAGYDILSFTSQGKMRLCEVKTTNGSIRTPFWISRNELNVSNENPEEFRLVRLFNFNRQPGAYKLSPPLQDHVNLKATQYHASF